jgi:hypothetical protein
MRPVMILEFMGQIQPGKIVAIQFGIKRGLKTSDSAI